MKVKIFDLFHLVLLEFGLYSFIVHFLVFSYLNSCCCRFSVLSILVFTSRPLSVVSKDRGGNVLNIVV